MPFLRIPFLIEKKLTIGELMTIVSILFSSISVLISWNNDQKIKILENATQTRVAVAKTLNTVNKVIQIHLSFYDLIEEDIAEASRILLEEKKAYKSRDYMWEKFYKHRAEVSNMLSQNDWEIAYTNLLTHGISIDTLYIKSINRIKGLREVQFNLLLRDYEKQILHFPTDSTNANTLTDRLRDLKNDYLESHKNLSRAAVSDLETFCINLLASPDSQLLFGN